MVKISELNEESFERVKTSSREEWLKERGKGLGGSDAGAIMGLSSWKNTQTLYQEKIGVFESEETEEDLEKYEYGRYAEEHIRNLYALRNKDKYIVTHNDNENLISKKYPFLRASLDGELTEIGTNRKGIWECKTANILNSSKALDWKDGVPNTYYCQLIHYFIVTNYDFAELTAELQTIDKYGNEVYTHKTYHFERSMVLADINELLKQEIEFWHYVETRTIPPLKINL